MASGSTLPIPLQEDGATESFQALAEQFRLIRESMDYIKHCKIKTLNDLRFFFANESEVATFLSQRAWHHNQSESERHGTQSGSRHH